MITRVNMKFCTPEAYAKRFGMTLDKAGLTAEWHMVKGKRSFGVIVIMDEEGEVDMVDEDIEGVEETEEIESGDDELRDGQAEAKFNYIAGGLDATAFKCGFGPLRLWIEVVDVRVIRGVVCCEMSVYCS